MTAHGEDLVDRLHRLVDDIDVEAVIGAFDVRFDMPMRHAEAVWLLELKNAFDPVAERADGRALAVRVGAFWCRIVSSDVRFQLAQGLEQVQRSRDDALALRAVDGELAAYAAARWADGAGKLLYRTGSHARGRMLFEDAQDIARHGDLWWCLPDVRSNFLRGRLEEARLVGDLAAERVARAVADLYEAVEQTEAIARARGVGCDGEPGSDRDREFRRGYRSLLHNLSIAVHLEGDVDRSRELAERVHTMSVAAADPYREAQALLQRINLLTGEQSGRGGESASVRALLHELAGLGWPRGALIAAQRLAVLDGGEPGIRALLGLVSTSTSEVSAGLDVDSAAFCTRLATNLAEAMEEPARSALLAEIRAVQLDVARSVRQVIALPAYKRAYARTMRPVYSAGVRQRLDDVPAGSGPEWWEGTLALVEESNGRELLDLMASSSLPTLELPSAPARAGRIPVPGPAGGPRPSPSECAEPPRRGGRRSRPVRSTDAAAERDRLALLEREQAFEEQFLRNPLPAAAHDPEIARKAEGFVTNHPGTCIVRYFTHGSAGAELAAFVIRDRIGRPVPCGDLAAVRSLVEELVTADHPGPGHSARIWELLLAPLWPRVAPGGREPEHLVIVPADELFAVPFHIAAPEGGIPLGARLPLSQSVSLTTFLLRNRDQLRRQRVEADDDLAAMILQDWDPVKRRFRVSGDEIAMARWRPEHLHVAGDVPAELAGRIDAVDADWRGLAELASTRPEFFVYAGHGTYLPEYGELGPYLQIKGDGGADRLTSYDVALRLRLPRNRLTVLGACVAGQGAHTAGGDVAGFLRAFIAAGAGAIALPLWQVRDAAVVDTAGRLLRASRRAVGADGTGTFDVVATLFRHYRDVVDVRRAGWIDDMPLVLYT